MTFGLDLRMFSPFFPETVPLHLWRFARGCWWLCPLSRPLQLLPQVKYFEDMNDCSRTFPPTQPARLPRELKQGFQVQEGWCKGRSTRPASGAVGSYHWENLNELNTCLVLGA